MDKERQIEETYIVNNEQIEEMANFLWKNTLIHTEDLCHDVSETCYNKGYRKQEWISVDERLPKQSGKYLVCTKNGNVYQTKFYSYPERTGGHWGQKDKGKSITHWTNLPPPPKNN